MAKAEQILVLDPAQELHFKGPFTDVVTSYLKLTNPSERRVCFKVKTTAPKKYCVRPNSGVLEPKKNVTVHVMLQPFDYNPNEKNKHKFMVQTMFVPEGEIDQDHLWREAKPESLMDSKLKCVFDMPSEDVQNNDIASRTVKVVIKPDVCKNVTETIKSSLKVSTTESDVKNVIDDNKRLRDEIMQLKQENVQLKDEGIRLRTRSGYSTTDSVSRAASSHPASNQKESMKISESLLSEQSQSPMLYLAVMLTIGLLGIFIGKFVV